MSSGATRKWELFGWRGGLDALEVNHRHSRKMEPGGLSGGLGQTALAALYHTDQRIEEHEGLETPCQKYWKGGHVIRTSTQESQLFFLTLVMVGETIYLSDPPLNLLWQRSSNMRVAEILQPKIEY